MIVLDNDLQAHSKLMQIVDTLNALGLRLGTGEGWQKQRRNNSHNGDNNQQLDESKAVAIAFAHVE